MIDLHAHVLPGLDDGPDDLRAAIALVAAAAADGTRTIVATPHVSERWPNDPARIAAAVEGLRAALRSEGIDVEILPGAEIAWDRAATMSDEELLAFGLGGGPCVLVEPPLRSTAGDADHVFEGLLARGHRVVLAHPERCPAFQREPERVTRLAAQGARCSVTASALVGRFGSGVQRFAQRLLRDGLVHDLASDAHDLAGRRPELAGPIAQAAAELPGLDVLGPWLTTEAPAALLTGRPAGPPPARVGRAPAARPPGRLRRLIGR